MADFENIRRRWENGRKIKGSANVITLPDGKTLNGCYYLVGSGTVTASHNALNGFVPSEGFPTDANGNSVNDRQYHRSKSEQDITRNIAASYDSRAIQSPVIVSPDGVVLSGNGRTMAGELAAYQNTDCAYIDYLKTYCGNYGFTHEQVTIFEHPRVVFVLDNALPYTVETFAMFNAPEMKENDKTEDAIKSGRLVSDETFGRIIATINAFETLGDFYGCTEAATRCINELLKARIINDKQYPSMFDGDSISLAGREKLENVLIGKAFADSPDSVRMITEYKSLRKSVVFALSEVATNLGLGEEYTLNDELSEAINLAYVARQHGYKAGERVSEYARQMDAFSGETVCDYSNTCILVLADALNNEQVTLLKRIFAVYNHQAQDSAAGQTDMFTVGGIRKKADILSDVRAIFAKGTTEEQKKAVSEAQEARLSENIFLTEEQATKVLKGSYVEFTCGSGDVIVCQVDDIKRRIAYLSGKGGIKFWCCVSELRPTADHTMTLPEWISAGTVITDGKATQKIVAVTDGFVIFEWVNGGYFDMMITEILRNWHVSESEVCEVEDIAA